MQSSAVSMQFWKPPPVSEHTRLAMKPALDKVRSDEEWKKELRPNTYQVSFSDDATCFFCRR